MQEKLARINKKAMELLKKEYGEDFKLEDGDSFVFRLNDGFLLLKMDERELGIEYCGNKVIDIDESLFD